MLVEPVVGSPWNGWPDVHGIGGRITVVRALTVRGGKRDDPRRPVGISSTATEMG